MATTGPTAGSTTDGRTAHTTPAGQNPDGVLHTADPNVHVVPQFTAVVAATISVGVGAIHLALAPEHLEHWWVFGSFFLAVGLFQVGYAAALLVRPTWQLALVGIVVNLAVVLTYVASRTVGLPIAPPEGGSHDEMETADTHGESTSVAGGYTEAVGPLDLTTAAAELVLIVLLVSLLPGRMRARTCNGLLLVGLALWALRITGALS